MKLEDHKQLLPGETLQTDKLQVTQASGDIYVPSYVQLYKLKAALQLQG